MAHQKKKQQSSSVVNRRASFDYALGEELVAGIVLSGREVRAARTGRVQLKGSFVTIRQGELWLNNASFSLLGGEKGKQDTTVDTSPRKLLVSKRQLGELEKAKASGLSIIPLRLLVGGRFIKLVIATGKGKKRYDKRQSIKQREQERESRRVR